MATSWAPYQPKASASPTSTWLSPIAVAATVASIAARRIKPMIAEIVEPLRDRLVRTGVSGGLRRYTTTGQAPDGSAVAQILGHSERVRDIAAGLLGELFRLGAAIAAAIVGLVALTPVGAAVVLLPVVGCGALLAALVPALVARHEALLAADEAVARFTTSIVGGRRDIVACGGEARAIGDASAAILAHAAAARRMARADVARTAIGAAGAQLPVLLLLFLAPWLYRDGHLSAGGVLGALTYVTAALNPAMRSLVDGASVSCVGLVVTWRRISAHADHAQAAERPDDGPTPGSSQLAAEHVTFAHDPGAQPIVDDLTLTVRAGEHLAIVGPSGVGKSTFADLLVGLTGPQRGAVCLGGIDLRALAPTRIHREIALIPQEAFVFTGTVRDNLTYLSPDAPDGDVAEAAFVTGMQPIVDRIGGLDARLGSDVELSAGELQLIALARAWLSPARIVILDEATCHLDATSEATVETAFRRRGGTLIVIAHRLGSALRADRVLVMDGERTVVGTHDELLGTSPLYAELVAAWEGTGPALT